MKRFLNQNPIVMFAVSFCLMLSTAYLALQDRLWVQRIVLTERSAQQKILNSIVILNPVDMVDNFFRREVAPKVLLHYKAVFHYPIVCLGKRMTIAFNNHVTIRPVASTTKQWVIFSFTKLIVTWSASRLSPTVSLSYFSSAIDAHFLWVDTLLFHTTHSSAIRYDVEALL